MCLRGQEAFQKSHQRLMHNPNFHETSSLVLGRIQFASEEPFGKSKQPALKIPTRSQYHVGHEKWVDGGRQKRPLENLALSGTLEGNPGLPLCQNMTPKVKTVKSREPIEDCDEIYESSPLVHKEKVTGHHHPYASKTRTGYASSSREKVGDDEDKNMSLTQSETNDEPRGDYFTVHEQGTQSNSQFTHP
ncbi:hypothetical protein O181_026968 [Austropuccinia psidii MF-1]|uniref:Uncharacterized protein n=1 Tax=Austropuccinia psidii MF-1 TaxID=1389203 RepID=A0A9Q3H0H6_9BASI|nr:hypothetical protein [Austropuccinia psidii MF-1]